jgi:dipeptidyl aminopeptidase/acylaminoacyl peptidase
MSNNFVNAVALRLAAILSCAALPAFADSHPPVEAFGTLPAISDPRLSPDGRYLAAVQTVDGKPVAVIYQINAPAGTKPAFVASPDGIIIRVEWAKNDRLVILEKSNMRVHMDVLRTWWRAMSVDPSGKNAVKLFSGDTSLWFNVSAAAISDIDLDDPDHIFMPIFKRGADWDDFVIDLDRVNVRDGTAETFVAGSLTSAGWIMDGHGHVIARYAAYPHEHVVHIKLPQGQNWREIASFATDSDDSNEAEGVTADGSALVISQSSDNRHTALYAIDMAKGTPSVLFANPNYDYADTISDEWTERIIGVSYVDDKIECEFFDPAREHFEKTLEAAFPGRSVCIVSSDLAHKAFVVATDSPQEPTTFYYFDAATMHASVIGTAYPQLPADALGAMKAYKYKARDGLDIPAYLTLPPDGKTRNLPLVVMPHGGPLARDSLSFDWWAQFLANRGYAVFQPNFRGSSGYGQSFSQAGNHEWGLKMQDDITDGVNKLVADGIADPKRICIVGASYGGYAALAGAAFTPDLYACAVSYAGVSDLGLMLYREAKQNGETSDVMSVLRSRIGDPDKDADRIAATSPAKHADRIKIPVLLLHASDDTTVPIEQSQVMNDALMKAKKNVRFIAINGDDHYLDLAATRVQVLTEIDKFLAANIGPQAAAAASSH